MISCMTKVWYHMWYHTWYFFSLSCANDIIEKKYDIIYDIIFVLWYHIWYQFFIDFLAFLAPTFYEIGYDIISISYMISLSYDITHEIIADMLWYGPLISLSPDIIAIWYQGFYDMFPYIMAPARRAGAGPPRVGAARGQVLHLLRPQYRQRAGDGCSAEQRRANGLDPAHGLVQSLQLQV